jgi:hypothetical protein
LSQYLRSIHVAPPHIRRDDDELNEVVDQFRDRRGSPISTDLGPNLSITGSLATILWLIALRREELHFSAWNFLRLGVFVMPPAFVLSIIMLSL